MSIFSRILSKLGFGGKDAAAATAPPSTPKPTSGPAPQPAHASATVPGAKPAPTSIAAPGAPAQPAAAPAASKPISEVDVVAKLEKLASANPEKLNWKVSIVDLLKLLDLDSSFAARKELAMELGAPAEKMGDSAQMNMWLHKTVLRKLAENGGNIPKELL